MIACVFPGQGAQHVRMGADLYESEPLFRRHVDDCTRILEPVLRLDLRSAVCDQTSVTQPALFVVEYALAKLCIEWGIRPKAMIGHSIGEYVAACLAGVFTLEDALTLVAARGRLMQSLPAGEMLAVGMSAEELTPVVTDGLSLGAVNGW